MRDKQNDRSETDESSPARDDESAREKSETPKSYYYDDATGYEIYKDEDDAVTEEQVDSAEDES